MASALTIFVLCLAAVSNVHAACNVPTYTESLTPNCAASNYRVKLPNYQNSSEYWICNSVGGTPVSEACDDSAPYFTYPLQACTTCESYIPAVNCSDLTIPEKPSCVAINGDDTSTESPTVAPTGSTTEAATVAPTANPYPTPKYPITPPPTELTTSSSSTKTTSSGSTNTTSSDITETPTSSDITGTPTSSDITETPTSSGPTESPTTATTGISGPGSPNPTVAPGVSTPPGPAPTTVTYAPEPPVAD